MITSFAHALFRRPFTACWIDSPCPNLVDFAYGIHTKPQIHTVMSICRVSSLITGGAERHTPSCRPANQSYPVADRYYHRGSQLAEDHLRSYRAGKTSPKASHLELVSRLTLTQWMAIGAGARTKPLGLTFYLLDLLLGELDFERRNVLMQHLPLSAITSEYPC
jgi:hypothetical protein